MNQNNTTINKEDLEINKWRIQVLQSNTGGHYFKKCYNNNNQLERLH